MVSLYFLSAISAGRAHIAYPLHSNLMLCKLFAHYLHTLCLPYNLTIYIFIVTTKFCLNIMNTIVCIYAIRYALKIESVGSCDTGSAVIWCRTGAPIQVLVRKLEWFHHCCIYCILGVGRAVQWAQHVTNAQFAECFGMEGFIGHLFGQTRTVGFDCWVIWHKFLTATLQNYYNQLVLPGTSLSWCKASLAR